MKRLIPSFFILHSALCIATSVHGAEITKFLVRQQWPWSAKVTIDYTLTGTGDRTVDVTPTFSIGGNVLDVPAASLSGDTDDVSAGERRIVWDPALATLPEGFKAGDLTVSLDVSTNKWLVIDLSAGPSAVSYPVSFEGMPVGGWTDESYKTTKLVLRHIPAGTFMQGMPETEASYATNAAQSEATISKDYYMAIYEMTRKQYALVAGTNVTDSSVSDATVDTFPARTTWPELRGPVNGVKWPRPGASTVDPESFMGILRSKVSLPSEITAKGYVFDLPTEAQWEFACRAGTTTSWNNGTDISLHPHPSHSNWSVDDNLDLLGWYRWNVGNDGKFRKVGQKQPNRWGLYDMHGNAPEFCLNRAPNVNAAASSGTDPMGPIYPIGNTYDYYRAVRGGGVTSNAADCRSASRSRTSTATHLNGIRLTLHDAPEGSW